MERDSRRSGKESISKQSQSQGKCSIAPNIAYTEKSRMDQESCYPANDEIFDNQQEEAFQNFAKDKFQKTLANLGENSPEACPVYEVRLKASSLKEIDYNENEVIPYDDPSKPKGAILKKIDENFSFGGSGFGSDSLFKNQMVNQNMLSSSDHCKQQQEKFDNVIIENSQLVDSQVFNTQDIEEKADEQTQKHQQVHFEDDKRTENSTNRSKSMKQDRKLSMAITEDGKLTMYTEDIVDEYLGKNFEDAARIVNIDSEYSQQQPDEKEQSEPKPQLQTTDQFFGGGDFFTDQQKNKDEQNQQTEGEDAFFNFGEGNNSGVNNADDDAFFNFGNNNNNDQGNAQEDAFFGFGNNNNNDFGNNNNNDFGNNNNNDFGNDDNNDFGNNNNNDFGNNDNDAKPDNDTPENQSFKPNESKDQMRNTISHQTNAEELIIWSGEYIEPFNPTQVSPENDLEEKIFTFSHFQINLNGSIEGEGIDESDRTYLIEGAVCGMMGEIQAQFTQQFEDKVIVYMAVMDHEGDMEGEFYIKPDHLEDHEVFSPPRLPDTRAPNFGQFRMKINNEYSSWSSELYPREGPNNEVVDTSISSTFNIFDGQNIVFGWGFDDIGFWIMHGSRIFVGEEMFLQKRYPYLAVDDQQDGEENQGVEFVFRGTVEQMQNNSQIQDDNQTGGPGSYFF